MEFRERRRVLLEMTLGKAAYARFLQDTLNDSSLSSILHRARVTLDGAWVRVTLKGTALRVARFLRTWRPAIVAITPLSKDLT